jgi:hypothetical protein
MIHLFVLNLIPHAWASTYFDLTDVAASTTAGTVNFISDMSPILKILLPILLGGLVLAMIIGAFHK